MQDSRNASQRYFARFPDRQVLCQFDNRPANRTSGLGKPATQETVLRVVRAISRFDRPLTLVRLNNGWKSQSAVFMITTTGGDGMRAGPNMFARNDMQRRTRRAKQQVPSSQNNGDRPRIVKKHAPVAPEPIEPPPMLTETDA